MAPKPSPYSPVFGRPCSGGKTQKLKLCGEAMSTGEAGGGQAPRVQSVHLSSPCPSLRVSCQPRAPRHPLMADEDPTRKDAKKQSLFSNGIRHCIHLTGFYKTESQITKIKREKGKKKKAKKEFLEVKACQQQKARDSTKEISQRVQ